jgi:hypothetical protein
MHPSERRAYWRICYQEMSLQAFGCHMLSLSLITNTGFSKWSNWIEVCDPNISVWITDESAIDEMEKMWLDFITAP